MKAFGPPCELCGHFETLDGWCLNYKCTNTGWRDVTTKAPSSENLENPVAKPEVDRKPD